MRHEVSVRGAANGRLTVSRFLFLTFDGGGNQPPAIGIAQALRDRGHEVRFAGYASQRQRFTASGFDFMVLERSQVAIDKAAYAGGWAPLLEGVLVCAAQIHEVPEAVTRARADVVVVDCMMFAALAAC